MQIITILLEEREERVSIRHVASDGVTPELGESACRFVADQFRAAAMEAEIERRVKEAQGADDDDT